MPDELQPGDMFQVDAGDVGSFEVAVPDGCTAGSVIAIELPSSSDADRPESPSQPLVEVEIPPGCGPGTNFLVESDGIQFSVITPDGYTPGDMLQVALPPQQEAASGDPMETEAPPSAKESTREAPDSAPSSELQLAKWNVTSELRSLSLAEAGDSSTSSPPAADEQHGTASSTKVQPIEGGDAYEFDFSKGPPDYSTMDRMKKLEVMSEYRRWKADQADTASRTSPPATRDSSPSKANRVAPAPAHPKGKRVRVERKGGGMSNGTVVSFDPESGLYCVTVDVYSWILVGLSYLHRVPLSRAITHRTRRIDPPLAASWSPV